MLTSGTIIVYDAAGPRAADIINRLGKVGLLAERLNWPSNADIERPPAADVAVLVCGAGVDTDQIAALAARLSQQRTTALVWAAQGGIVDDSPYTMAVDPDAAPQEVVGRVATLAHYAPVLQRLDEELQHLQRLSQHFHRYIDEIDQDMRLAGRLQRDFLPRSIPDCGDIRVSVMYRPASWVSGDLYDVFKADDRHIGLLIADVMGHGTSAALLSMFVRQALVARRGDQVVSPSAALAGLHENLGRQRLPRQQYVTAAYVLLDRQTLTARVARGGHPYPILICANGELRECDPAGGLVGLSDMSADFDECQVQLARGDKLLLFTDGLEDTLLGRAVDKASDSRLPDVLAPWAGLPGAELVAQIERHLDTLAGSLHPSDDMTLLVAEVAA